MSTPSPISDPPPQATAPASNTIPTDPTPSTADLPLPLSASIVLTSLPIDAAAALENADTESGVPDKVTIRFQPVGSAPQLRQRVFKVSSKNRFETVVGFLGRKLAAAGGAAAAGEGGGVGGGKGEGGGGSGGQQKQQVFCYVNSVFAPGLDEGVGGLWRCFKTDDQLTVAYSMTPAFG